MSVLFSPSLTLRSSTWTILKAARTLRSGTHQYESIDGAYRIWFYDGPELYTCSIWQGAVPADVIAGGYSQAQNDADKDDFEDNYLAYANQPLSAGQFDPRLIHCLGNLTSASTSEVLMYARTYAEPASQAQRSIVGGAQDGPGGSGMKAARLVYLNSAYEQKIEDFVLNGATPVNSVGTDIRFVQDMFGIEGAAASSAVKLMTATGGGGTEIAGIGTGTDRAFFCHHYVPVGKRAFVLGWGADIDGNANFKLKGQERFGANLVDRILDLQNLMFPTLVAAFPNRPSFYRKFPAPLPIGEKCYIRVTVVPGQAGSTVERSTLDIWEDKA
jgi:hypothetical protein